MTTGRVVTLLFVYLDSQNVVTEYGAGFYKKVKFN